MCRGLTVLEAPAGETGAEEVTGAGPEELEVATTGAEVVAVVGEGGWAGPELGGWTSDSSEREEPDESSCRPADRRSWRVVG